MVKKIALYGGRGRPWNENFIKYMLMIVNNPVYKGMPDAFYEPGRIQWEAPSNRASGKFKFTHRDRYKWWVNKAKEIGVSTSSEKWISRVAKKIHPTKKKPCKICGRVLELNYVYPQERLLNKIKKIKYYKYNFKLNRLEPIQSLLTRLYDTYGEPALESFPELLKSDKIPLPNPIPKTFKDWLNWVNKDYVPGEPRILSPGAMSNAPDRFDGFHCDNLCCRGTADKGRSKENLRTYVTDRRVFEYWTSGNWIAADRVMGLIKKDFRKENCRNGHPGPCDADHIGPISLGFLHRPRFQLLCSSCNSAKNNRMTLSDVKLLLEDEKQGEPVISWHSNKIWDLCKAKISNDDEAKRLSMLLRDNRHTYMHVLKEIEKIGAYSFLSTLLELQFADQDIEFENLHIENHLTVFSKVKFNKRTTKYALEQKVRRCRIAFNELRQYFKKENRNEFIEIGLEEKKLFKKLIEILVRLKSKTERYDKAYKKCFSINEKSETRLRDLLRQMENFDFKIFEEAHHTLQNLMDKIGISLSGKWNNERYLRLVSDE